MILREFWNETSRNIKRFMKVDRQHDGQPSNPKDFDHGALQVVKAGRSSEYQVNFLASQEKRKSTLCRCERSMRNFIVRSPIAKPNPNLAMTRRIVAPQEEAVNE